ncbi:MAG: hypothetical protein ACKVP9_13990 [Burkholderiales bacterium]
MRSERPVGQVPMWVVALLAGSLAMQVLLRVESRPAAPSAEDLPAAPRPALLRVAALGEPAALARLGMLYLQAFDYHGGNSLPYSKLDYVRLVDWLSALQRLDEKSEYPLFIASRVYAEVPDSVRQRQMLEFIYASFLVDPSRRWKWAAHAALLAKHRLKDLPLALKYARAIDRFAGSAPNVPMWARQMEIFILEDMNELDAARILLGGLLESGQIDDPGERLFLQNRLKEMESRVKKSAR